MPILEVEIVLRPNESLPDGLAIQLADCAGNLFGSSPGETWVKVRPIPAEQYAENGGLLPEGFYPVFVSVLKARPPSGDDLQTEVSELTSAIAHVCARPTESIHLFYQPDARGRVAFGGRLVIE
jgi:phenylpyruvate tautomerase PptA (4-oxalocrotonate tautomerase family)